MANIGPSINGNTGFRNNYLDIWRGIALLAVFIVHFLAGLDGTIYTTHPLRLVFILINQLMRFSVPLFIALSGYSLAQKYQRHTFTFIPFMTKRMAQLIPPFILWSLAIALLLRVIPVWSINVPAFTFTNFVLGQLDYHLYFIPVLLSLYLIFPLIHKFGDIDPSVTVILCLGLQTFWYLVLWYPQPQANWVHLPKDQIQYVIPLTWIGYFSLGNYVGSRRVASTHLSQKILITLGLFGLIYSTYQAHRLQLYQNIDIIITTRFTRLPILMYAVAVIYLILSHASHTSIKSYAAKIIAWLGKNSYPIYLVHTIILRLYFSWLVQHQLVLTQALGISLFLIFTGYISNKSTAFVSAHLLKYTH